MEPRADVRISKCNLQRNEQLDGAHTFLKKVGSGELDIPSLEESAGVGMVVTAEDTEQCTAEVVLEHKEEIMQERYLFNPGPLLGKLRSKLKWADGRFMKQELDRQICKLIGPKTEEDEKVAQAPKKTKSKREKPAAKESKEETEVPNAKNPYAHFPDPAENNYVHTEVHLSWGKVMHIANTREELDAHLKRTGGRVQTRFPPEPNGYLHIGHAKACFVDFGMAEDRGGVCYLRFDDTNPEAEKLEFIDHIQDIVGWLGWKPWKITYSSDYFEQLHAFAVQLIKKDKAYVCHQKAEEIKMYRERKQGSPWRDRPLEESLKLFEDMRRGMVCEGDATLRLKMDPRNENFNMFDLIAYRVKFAPHPHIGDKWCIYPSYDYTHCIVDALEDITHSLCTLEFETRRASYYWLLDAIAVYKPYVWEYARLNITHNVLSKRKLQALVKEGYVDGWDDPRLLTLAGLRRRGVRPQAINSFCAELGVTRNDNMVHLHRLEHHVRADLNECAQRAMAVLDPVKIILENFPDDEVVEVVARRMPGESGDTYTLPFSKTLYIESTDIREEDSKGYYGLAPGKSVMLRYAFMITCTSIAKDRSGKIVEAICSYNPEKPPKPPKGVIHWVAEPSPGQKPQTFNAHLYEPLFSAEVPGEKGDWIEDLNPDSRRIMQGCLTNDPLMTSNEKARGVNFQFERVGYFFMDEYSKDNSLVMNRVVTLRESREVKGIKTQ